MKLVTRLVIALVFVALAAATAYGVGLAARPASGTPDARAARPSSAPSSVAAAPTTGTPTTTLSAAPSSPTTAPSTPASTPDQPTSPPPSARPAELEPGRTLLAPGDEGDDVRDLQARLRQIDWFDADVTGYYGDVTRAAVQGFQAKREIPVTGEVDRRTLGRLGAMTTTPTEAELHASADQGGNVPGALDARCKTGRVLCIDKTSRTLRFVVDGSVQQTLDVRFGASYTPTREGVFSVYSKDADHVSRLYGSSMPYAMFFSGGQAVHYSSDFATVGYAGASHGCVNVRDYDGVAELFGRVRVGDRVVVYWS